MQDMIFSFRMDAKTNQSLAKLAIITKRKKGDVVRLLITEAILNTKNFESQNLLGGQNDATHG